MSDFEAALCNSLRIVYALKAVMCCCFHYCQCLWLYAAKHKMQTSSRIGLTRKLITLLKVLPHIDLEGRKSLFEEIKEVFKRADTVYKDFLFYYCNNWLTTFSIDFDEIEDGIRLVRANNVCEQYNRRIRQKVNIKHPRLAILVKVLLEEESIFKKKVVGSLYQVNIDIFLNHSSINTSEILPFSAFTNEHYNANKDRYALRSVIKNQKLITNLENLSEKWEKFLFLKLKSQAEIDR